MGIHGAHQGALLTLRAKSRIHVEEGPGCQPHHLPRHPGCDGAGVLTDEDHVDVADVIQFAGSAFAHRDDGQTRRRRTVFADVGDGDLQGSVQRRVSEIRQLRSDGGESQHRLVLDGRCQIEGGQDQQLVPIEPP